MVETGPKNNQENIYKLKPDEVNPGGLTIFCDVDGTLYENNEHYLNEELMKAWKDAGIKHVYLMTSMSADEPGKIASEIGGITRKDIVKKLSEYGIKVKGVCTTFDLFLDAAQHMDAPHPHFEDFLKTRIKQTQDMNNLELFYEESLDDRIINRIISKAEQLKVRLKEPEIKKLTKKTMASLEEQYNQFTSRYPAGGNNFVVGNYYKELIEPHYKEVKPGKGNLQLDPDYLATIFLQNEFIKTNLKSKKDARQDEICPNLDLHNTSAAGEKAALSTIFANEAQSVGANLTNVAMLDDAAIATELVPEALKPAGIEATGTIVSLDATMNYLDREYYLGSTLMAIQKSTSTSNYKPYKQQSLEYAQSIHQHFSDTGDLIALYAEIAKHFNDKYNEIFREKGKEYCASKANNLHEIKNNITILETKNDRISPSQLNALTNLREEINNYISINKLDRDNSPLTPPQEVLDLVASHKKLCKNINNEKGYDILKMDARDKSNAIDLLQLIDYQINLQTRPRFEKADMTIFTDLANKVSQLENNPIALMEAKNKSLAPAKKAMDKRELQFNFINTLEGELKIQEYKKKQSGVSLFRANHIDKNIAIIKNAINQFQDNDFDGCQQSCTLLIGKKGISESTAIFMNENIKGLRDIKSEPFLPEFKVPKKEMPSPPIKVADSAQSISQPLRQTSSRENSVFSNNPQPSKQREAVAYQFGAHRPPRKADQTSSNNEQRPQEDRQLNALSQTKPKK